MIQPEQNLTIQPEDDLATRALVPWAEQNWVYQVS
jgi:hypothetical protein